MATFNLVRNSRVFFTTNVDATTGVIPSSGATIAPTNTFELQVLDGFSFSQGTQQQTIQISEAGQTPTRGQRSFNTQLDPVEFSFTTYVRPKLSGGIVTAEEKVLWNALMSSVAIDTGLALTTTALTRASTTTNVATLTCSAANFTAAGIAVGDYVAIGGLPAGVTNAQEWAQPAKIQDLQPNATAATTVTLAYVAAPSTAAGATAAAAPTAATIYKSAWVTTQVSSVSKAAFAYAHSAVSNKNQLQKFGMYIFVDNILYAIDNCALDQASIDFGLDGIASITWAGKGTALRQLNASTNTASISGSPAVFAGTGNATGTAAAKDTTAQYITNKLSTMTLQGNIMGGGTTYNLALTGGNLTIANNINYVIPANLGVVNQPVGYFTGTRSISGSVNAYLRTGTGNSAQVLNDILTANAAETKFKMQIEVGGITNAVRMELKMNGAMLQVPTVETADVMSTTINFTAQGYDPVNNGVNTVYDLEQTNDLQVTYFSA